MNFLPTSLPGLFIILALLLGTIAVRIWYRVPRPPVEYTPETPAIPPKVRPKLKASVKDRLAMAQRRAHAREVRELAQVGPR